MGTKTDKHMPPTYNTTSQPENSAPANLGWVRERFAGPEFPSYETNVASRKHESVYLCFQVVLLLEILGKMLIKFFMNRSI